MSLVCKCTAARISATESLLRRISDQRKIDDPLSTKMMDRLFLGLLS